VKKQQSKRLELPAVQDLLGQERRKRTKTIFSFLALGLVLGLWCHLFMDNIKKKRTLYHFCIIDKRSSFFSGVYLFYSGQYSSNSAVLETCTWTCPWTGDEGTLSLTDYSGKPTSSTHSLQPTKCLFSARSICPMTASALQSGLEYLKTQWNGES
jgi:hypothetical protein